MTNGHRPFKPVYDAGNAVFGYDPTPLVHQPQPEAVGDDPERKRDILDKRRQRRGQLPLGQKTFATPIQPLGEPQRILSESEICEESRGLPSYEEVMSWKIGL